MVFQFCFSVIVVMAILSVNQTFINGGSNHCSSDVPQMESGILYESPAQGGIVEIVQDAISPKVKINIGGPLVLMIKDVNNRVVHVTTPPSYEWFRIPNLTEGTYWFTVGAPDKNIDPFSIYIQK